MNNYPIHTLLDADGTVQYDRFDSCAVYYTVGDEIRYKRCHIVFAGPRHFVYPARSIDENAMPYGPYEWIHYRHVDLPEVVLPPGARRV